MVSNEELAERFYAALNAHDSKKVGEQLTEDVNYWEANLPEPIHGRRAVEEHFEQNWKAFPETSMQVVNRVVSGDWTADEVEWTGTNSGPIKTPTQTIPATGKQAKMWLMAVTKRSGDKVSGVRVYYDQVGLLAQLGLMEPPGSE